MKKITALPHYRITALLLQLIMLFVLAIPLAGQKAEIQESKCQPEKPKFTGKAETTTCENYPNFNCTVQIGAGTPFPKSSLIGTSLTGNVCVIGNFEVDADFAFNNAVVKITPGVIISIKGTPNGYDNGSRLGINNSKLFACDGLWKGITMGLLSYIYTLNNSVIEDAETAIFTNTFVALSIMNTTFNRNKVGIYFELTNTFSNWWYSPLLYGFSGNTFKCTAPLNGTMDEITQVGVKLKDADFIPWMPNGNNIFENIAKGIEARGTSSNVYVNDFDFNSIRITGIDFKGRKLDVKNSDFINIFQGGIRFSESSILSLEYNNFSILPETASFTFYNRAMVEISKPLPGNDIRLITNNFSCEGDFLNGFSNIIDCIHLESYSVVSSFNVDIWFNSFYLDNLNIPGQAHTESRAVQISGYLAEDSKVDIRKNIFGISNNFNNNVGVSCQYGDKSNVHIIDNDFDGGGRTVDFVESSGIGNEISHNDIFGLPSSFGSGIFMRNWINTIICSNTFHGQTLVPFIFNGQMLNTHLLYNTIYGGWQQGLWISPPNSFIGQQVRYQNEWHPAIVNNDDIIFYVRSVIQNDNTDLDKIELSKFIVPTNQSIWNNNQYSFFSEFYPASDQIIAVDDDKFFKKISGTLAENCTPPFNDPDYVDLKIANGGYASLFPNQATVFDAKRYLYKRLKENPAYQTTHTDFSAFLATEQNTSVGKFYELEKAINNAFRLSETDKLALDNIELQSESKEQWFSQQTIDPNQMSMQPNFSQSNLITNLAQRKSLNDSRKLILDQSKINQTIALNNAITILQTISPQNIFEQNRKDVWSIFLISQTQQNGNLTKAQILALQEIARLCSEVGGSAVSLAQGFLSGCDLISIMPFIEECNKVEEKVESRENILTRHPIISEDAQVQISPNPAKDYINILSLRQMAGDVEIYNMTGQLLTKHDIGFGENSIRLNLNSGVYFLRVIYANGDTTSHKIVISK